MMSLLLNLSPDVEAQLRAAAQATGSDPLDVVEQVLKAHLPTISIVPPKKGEGLVERDTELVAKVKRTRGKFAHTVYWFGYRSSTP